MDVSICNSLNDVSETEWDALGNSDYPFTRYAYLYGLELFDCLEPFGWHPVYILIRENNRLVAALACYIKTNSYGELVFDHAWAQAYHRSGIEYYPKLVTAIPYTPATGDRFLINYAAITDQQQIDSYRLQLCSAALTFCEEHQLSSWHVLFAERSILQSIKSQLFLLRSDIQFHWQNQGYESFDHFLSVLSSRKRKNIRKERRSAGDHGLDIQMQAGGDLEHDDWQRIYELYAGIYDRKHGTPTLNAGFFQHLGDKLDQGILVNLARDRNRIVAASVFFRSHSHLYGRVWGCDDYYRDLHFECCYYQGIDYCIKHKLDWFDPGAQGEHKLSRGFLPTKTWSGHWISHPQFRKAIEQFLTQEKHHIDLYQTQLMSHSPYRSGGE